MDPYDDAWLCPVCLLVFKDPRSLPCGHSFCSKCVAQIAESKRNFPCPTCRKNVDLSLGGVDGLPKNYNLGFVIQEREGKSSSVCSEHKKLLELYCAQCNLVICSKCVFKLHNGHTFEDVEEVCRERKERMSELLKSIKAWHSQTKEKRDRLEGSMHSMKAETETSKTAIANIFKKWSVALDMKLQSLLNFVTQEEIKRNIILDEDREIFQRFLKHLEDLENELNNILCSDAIYIVKAYNSLKERYMKLGIKVKTDVEIRPKSPYDMKYDICAPGIEKAICNITLIDSEQTRHVTRSVHSIQEGDQLLKMKSSQAAERMNHDYPNIMDLSDQDRLTKIANRYSELYDQQWTDAFKTLQRKYHQPETEIIAFLLDVLYVSFIECKEARAQREGLFKTLIEYVGADGDDQDVTVIEVMRTLNGARKQNINKMQKSFKKKVQKRLATKTNYEKMLQDIRPYMDECVETCFLMNIQYLPMELKGLLLSSDARFDISVFKPYTKYGEKIEYIVWPAMYLYFDGPLLCKGVAQGYEETKEKVNSGQKNEIV